MKSEKRVIKATLEVVERQYLKMLFVLDDLQKDLEELPPGSTIGEKGERAFLLLDYASKGTTALGYAKKYFEMALETYEKKGGR